MYSVDDSTQSSTIVKEVTSCKAINKTTGEICGERDGLRILDDFRKLYETRIEKIDQDHTDEFDRASLKLQIMTEWVKDLGEQNVMLVNTVEDLEQAASSRVTLLEEKLRRSSNIVTENMSRSHQSEEALNMLSSRVGQLEKDEEYLQQRIEFLQSDIRSLLELIRRAQKENCWSLDGIKFFEIQPSDIPIPLDCTCGQEEEEAQKIRLLKLQLEKLEENEKKAISYQAELEEKLADMKEKVTSKEETIKNYVSKLQTLSENLKRRSKLENKIVLCSGSTSIDLDSDIAFMVEIVESVLNEKDLEVNSLRQQLQEMEFKVTTNVHENNTEVVNLRSQLEERMKEMQQIESQMACLQKDSLETREALTAEVAEKHDLVMSLRREVAALEEQCRHANMQTHFKDDIIKELRKELKQATTKDNSTTRKVRIDTESCQEKFSSAHSDTASCSSSKCCGATLQLCEAQKQLKSLKRALNLKVNEATKLRKELDLQRNKSTELCKIMEKLCNCRTSLKEENDTLNNSAATQQDKIASYLTNTKLLMEKEKEALVDLKVELEKIFEKLHIYEKEVYNRDISSVHNKLQDIQTLLNNYKTQVIDHSECPESVRGCITAIEVELNCVQSTIQDKYMKYCTNKSEPYVDDMLIKLAKNIDDVKKMCSEKQKAISFVDFMTKKCNESTVDVSETQYMTNATILQQFKLLEEFRICTVEAQAATEDIRDEIETIVTTLNSRHQKYNEMSNVVVNVYDQLTQTREDLMDAINQLDLQEEERMRHNERITNGSIKIKDIKNDINRAQMELSRCVDCIPDNTPEHRIIGFSEVHICNDLLSVATEEVEQLVNSLQVFQAQGTCTMSTLAELKSHLCAIECNIKNLRKKMDEVLVEDELAQTMFCEKEKRLEKLEGEIDCAHTKMQDVLETILSITEQESGNYHLDSQMRCQREATDEVLKVKDDLHKLRKEYHDFKQTSLQQTCQAKYNERINQWKNRVTDLQDQIRILQHEAKCKQEASAFFKRSMESMEKELSNVQSKAEMFRKCHSTDNVELKKKILELESALRMQKEVECNLKKSLDSSEVELKRSREHLDAHTEYGIEGSLLRSGYPSKYENPPHLFKVLQDTILATKSGLYELENELKKLVCENSSHSCSSTGHVMAVIDKVVKNKEEIDNCTVEVEKLKSTVCSKDKLLENKDEIIRIQKDSIIMTQTELKDLHQKFQEKIDTQDRIIMQFEKEKKQLLQQNELQIQTIGHLQDAVVEAKKSLDHMGHKAMSDHYENSEVIRTLTMYVDETQSQYNECFAEAAKQDTLLELQREAITELQKKIHFIKYDSNIIITVLHNMYYSILSSVQVELQARVKDFDALKCKMDDLIKAKISLENKYANAQELLLNLTKSVSYETKDSQCCIEVEDKICMTESEEELSNIKCIDITHEQELQNELEIILKENEDIKKQLEKYKLDFEIVDKELKIEKANSLSFSHLQIELEKLKDVECCLQAQNQKLLNEVEEGRMECLRMTNDLCCARDKEIKLEQQVAELEKEQIIKIQEVEELNSSLQKNIECLKVELCDKETRLTQCIEKIGCLHDDIEIKNQKTSCDGILIKEQIQAIEDLQEKLCESERYNEEIMCELNAAKKMLCILRIRIHSLKTMLKEKSDNMAKLQVDYEVLKNENSILRNENNLLEMKAKEDVSQLKKKLQEAQLEICLMEDNYRKASRDFNKTQEQLLAAVNREVHLQESWTATEKEYCSKLVMAEREETRLGNLVDKLREELENSRKESTAKNTELYQTQCSCQNYAEKLHGAQQDIDMLQQEMKKVEENNCHLERQLQECLKENKNLSEERASLEENTFKYAHELEEMHKALLELRTDCQMKNNSLVCISAELTQAAASRSELCNESQYMVSCIRVWMEEQRKLVETLASRLRTKQQQLAQVGFEKKALATTIRELRRVNSILLQRLRRTHRPVISRNAKNVCAGCYVIPSYLPCNSGIRLTSGCSYSQLYKKCTVGPIKAARRTTVRGNSWWFPKMEYLTNELRKNNQWWNKNMGNKIESDAMLEESRDCGYQSSTSK